MIDQLDELIKDPEQFVKIIAAYVLSTKALITFAWSRPEPIQSVMDLALSSATLPIWL